MYDNLVTEVRGGRKTAADGCTRVAQVWQLFKEKKKLDVPPAVAAFQTDKPGTAH
jgi:hypothetical protein